MAKRTSVVLTCDLPHDEPVTVGVITITLGYEGKTYDVELCPVHAGAYHSFMKQYIDPAAPAAAAKPAGRKSGAKRSPAKKSVLDTAAVRAWARENGYTLGDRGRISADIVEAYELAR